MCERKKEAKMMKCDCTVCAMRNAVFAQMPKKEKSTFGIESDEEIIINASRFYATLVYERGDGG